MTRRANGLQYGSQLSYGTAMHGCDSNAAVFASAADMQTWLTGGADPMNLDADAQAFIKTTSHDQAALAIREQFGPDGEAYRRVVPAINNFTGTQQNEIMTALAQASTEIEVKAVLDAVTAAHTDDQAEAAQIATILGIVQAGGIDTTAAATQIAALLKQSLPSDVITALLANLQTPAAPPAGP